MAAAGQALPPGRERTDVGDLRQRLRSDSERRQEDAEGQRHNEPNGREPHGDLLLRHGWPLI